MRFEPGLTGTKCLCCSLLCLLCIKSLLSKYIRFLEERSPITQEQRVEGSVKKLDRFQASNSLFLPVLVPTSEMSGQLCQTTENLPVYVTELMARSRLRPIDTICIQEAV